MTGLEIFFSLVSTIGGIASSIMQANAAAEEAEAQARINEKNAEIAAIEASQQRKRADIEAQNAIQEKAAAQRAAQLKKKEAARLSSQQRAKYAASGIDLWGSAAEVVADTEAMGDYNAEMELWQGDERARAKITEEIGYRQQGVLKDMDSEKYRMAAGADRQRAKNIKKQGVFSAVTSGISGIGGAISSAGGSGGGSFKYG